MNLYEENLKKIISGIEKFGAIKDVGIENNSVIITPPNTPKKPGKSKLIEIDLNRAREFTIRFIMGDKKETN